MVVSTDERPGGKKKAVFIITVATAIYVLAVLERLSPPVVALDIARDLLLNDNQMGMMFAATFVAYGLMQPFSGYSADRFGPRRCLLVSALVVALASIWFSLAHSYPAAAVARALVGLGGGLALMSCMKLVRNWLPPSSFSLAASGIIAASALANLLAGTPLAVFSRDFGWRAAFWWLGLIGLLLWAFGAWAIKNKPQGGAALGPPGVGAVGRVSFKEIWREVVATPRFWFLGLVYAGLDCIYITFSSLWAGPYLIDMHGQSSTSAGNMLSVAALGFLAGPPLWAALGGLGRSNMRILWAGSLLNVLIAAFFVWGPGGLSVPMLYVLCFVAPIGAQTTALVFTVAADVFPERLAASTMGVLNAFPILLGALFQKLVGQLMNSGKLLNESGLARLSPADLYQKTFMPLFIWMVICAVLATILYRKIKV